MRVLGLHMKTISGLARFFNIPNFQEKEYFNGRPSYKKLNGDSVYYLYQWNPLENIWYFYTKLGGSIGMTNLITLEVLLYIF